jgi:hypothetical protein
MKVLEIALDVCRTFPCNIKKLTVLEFACCNEVRVTDHTHSVMVKLHISAQHLSISSL